MKYLDKHFTIYVQDLDEGNHNTQMNKIKEVSKQRYIPGLWIESQYYYICF